MVSTRDPVRRRQPVERPLDIVGLELLVSVSQALLAGILLSLAAQLGGDARAQGLPVPGLLALLGLAVGVGWVWWLMGGSSWVMSAVCLATAILAGALWLLSLQDDSLPRIDLLVGLIALACATYGVVAGVFLPGPHREHWKGGISQPHRGLPQTRATPARFSPPVQKVVDERLSNVHVPRVTLPAVTIPSVKLPARSPKAGPDTDEGDSLAPAADIAPRPGTQAAEVGSRADVSPIAEASSAPVVEDIPALEPATPASGQEATAQADGVLEGEPAADATDTAAPPADPDAPTKPVKRTADAWPRPIDPHGRGSASDDDTDGGT
jgi:hypothetical protein